MSELHKQSWSSANWFKLFFLLILISTIAGGFYFYQYLPTQIRKQCSYKTVTKPAIPYRAAMTQDQMEKAGMIHDCSVSNYKSIFDDKMSDSFKENLNRVYDESCKSDNKKRIAHYTKEQKAVPARHEQIRNDEDEYSLCLRDNGI